MATANNDLALSCSGICPSITAGIRSSAPNDSIFLVKYAPQLSVLLVDDSSTKDLVSTGRPATSGSGIDSIYWDSSLLPQLILDSVGHSFLCLNGKK